MYNLKTVGYINLKTRKFYSTKEEWLASKIIDGARKVKSETISFFKKLVALSALDIAKSKLKMGYTWERFINFCKAKINVLRSKAKRVLR